MDTPVVEAILETDPPLACVTCPTQQVYQNIDILHPGQPRPYMQLKMTSTYGDPALQDSHSEASEAQRVLRYGILQWSNAERARWAHGLCPYMAIRPQRMSIYGKL